MLFVETGLLGNTRAGDVHMIAAVDIVVRQLTDDYRKASASRNVAVDEKLVRSNAVRAIDECVREMRQTHPRGSSKKRALEPELMGPVIPTPKQQLPEHPTSTAGASVARFPVLPITRQSSRLTSPSEDLGRNTLPPLSPSSTARSEFYGPPPTLSQEDIDWLIKKTGHQMSVATICSSRALMRITTFGGFRRYGMKPI